MSNVWAHGREEVHSVPSVHMLHAEFHAAFEVRVLEKQGDTNKRGRTTIDKGRHLTGEEWCDIMKEKEEKKRKEEDEKEQNRMKENKRREKKSKS